MTEPAPHPNVGLGVPEEERTAVVDQKQCMYVPHVQVIRAETASFTGDILIHNNETCNATAFTPSGASLWDVSDPLAPEEREAYLKDMAAWDATLLDGLEDDLRDPFPVPRTVGPGPAPGREPDG